MTRDGVIRMAREQGLPETEIEGVFVVNTDDLGRLIAAERVAAGHPVQRFGTQEREPTMQDVLMKFDPATGEERPYPSHATQWRNWHGIAAWLFDPWTGKRRNAYDVSSDVHGLLIAPTGTLGMDMGGGSAEKNNVAGGLVGSADGIKAQPAPSVPEGWKLVPIEPTPGMMRGAHRLVAAARRVLASADSQGLIRLDESGDVASELRSALEATPEAKP
jgi:hypothetical protein